MDRLATQTHKSEGTDLGITQTPDTASAYRCEACGHPQAPVALYDERHTDGTVRYGRRYCTACVESPATAMPTVEVLLLREPMPPRWTAADARAFARDLAALPGCTPATATDQAPYVRADRAARDA